MNTIPEKERFFYFVAISAIIVLAVSVIITTRRTRFQSLPTSQTYAQQSNSDELESIESDLEKTDFSDVDSEMKDIEKQF